jgi:hypothetical protein
MRGRWATSSVSELVHPKIHRSFAKCTGPSAGAFAETLSVLVFESYGTVTNGSKRLPPMRDLAATVTAREEKGDQHVEPPGDR